MAQREEGDLFAGTDNRPIVVPVGEFSAEGPDLDRLGASNARSDGRGGLREMWRSAPQQQRTNWIVAISVIAVLCILIPALIGVIGNERRSALEAAANPPVGEFVTLSAEVQEVQRSNDGVLGAYAVSSTFAEAGSEQEMKSKLDAVSGSVTKNDAGELRSLVESAQSYFVSDYAPRLADNVDVLMSQWTKSEYETDRAVTQAQAAVRSNLDRNRLDALVPAVIDLSTALTQARAEHIRNTSSGGTAPTTVAPAPTTVAPTTEAPQPTEPAPTPEPTQPPTPVPTPTLVPTLLPTPGQG